MRAKKADKIALLRKARGAIAGGRDNCLCYALSGNAVGYGEHVAADSLRRYIYRQLGKHTFLDSWVAQHRPTLSRDWGRMRKYRLQWIDWMISELEKP